jgi:hypothetical protein
MTDIRELDLAELACIEGGSFWGDVAKGVAIGLVVAAAALL